MLASIRQRRGKWGYSLVEVSLALLVAAIGLMTAFALFPDGLASSRKSVDATEISAFADYVFACLDNMSSSTNTAAWNAFKNNGMQLPVTHMFLGATNNTQPRIVPGGKDDPELYYWIPKDSYGEGDSAGVARYKIATFTYTLDVQKKGAESKYVRLEVWSGDVVDLVKGNDIGPGTVFYREFVPLE